MSYDLFPTVECYGAMRMMELLLTDLSLRNECIGFDSIHKKLKKEVPIMVPW